MASFASLLGSIMTSREAEDDRDLIFISHEVRYNPIMFGREYHVQVDKK